MGKEYLTEAMNEIQDKHLEEAIDTTRRRKKRIIVRRMLIAAVLILVLLSGILLSGLPGQETIRVEAADLMEHIMPQSVEAKPIEDAWRTAALDFSLDLFRNSLVEGENVLISPLSILNALGMTSNGAAGETKEQMEAAFGMTVEELNQYLYAYQQSLPSEGKNQVVLANSIWFANNMGLAVKRNFLQTNADWYGSAAYQIPFDAQAVKQINDWVNENTKGRIPELLQRLSARSVICLVNAMTFDAEWNIPYHSYQVGTYDFTNADGTIESAELMRSEEHIYLEDENAVGFMKYYADREYAFVALLPNEGMTVEEYAATLDAQHVDAVLNQAEDICVYASIPKFNSEYGAEMKDVLVQMGISDAFDMGNADFSEMGKTDSGMLYVSSVQHKAVLEVDEQGTRGAAATVVETADGGAMIEDFRVVILNRPFVYMIIDCANRQPIFIGSMNHIH